MPSLRTRVAHDRQVLVAAKDELAKATDALKAASDELAKKTAEAKP